MKNTNELIARAEAVTAFLCGDGGLDGVAGFGDCHPTRLGAFWWRTDLRSAFNGLIAALKASEEALRAEREARERAEAMVAAAYRNAANVANTFDHPAIASVSGDTTAMRIAEVILARTPEDASAALAHIRQEAADEALERAAAMAERRWHGIKTGHGEKPGSEWLNVVIAWRDGESRAIADAIRALKCGAK